MKKLQTVSYSNWAFLNISQQKGLTGDDAVPLKRVLIGTYGIGPLVLERSYRINCTSNTIFHSMAI
jgi:hypothetical protein